MRRFRPDTHSACKAMTIRAGATVPSPAISNARPRRPARSTNVLQTRGTRPATMPRRPPIKTRPPQVYLPSPSGPHPTEAPISVVLESLIRNRPRTRLTACLKGRCRHVLPSRTICRDIELWCFGAGQNLLPCSSDMRGHDESSSVSRYGRANSQCPVR
jgi:hypothetical protein